MAMRRPEQVWPHTKVFLQELKAKTKPFTVEVEGIELVVLPGVFPPATDSRLLASHIRVKPGERFLDATTGCGVFAVVAGLQGGEGVAADINPQAVRNAQENFRHHGLNIEAIQSDMFENVSPQQFDHIFVNGPF